MSTRATMLVRATSFAVLLAAQVRAEPERAPEQDAVHATALKAPSEASPIAPRPEPSFRFEGAAYLYFLPDSPGYIQPTLRADHRLFHFEARYNYEDRRTGSAWFGLNAAGGDDVWWEITPIIGAAFGHTNGLAVGYEGALGWWKLELSSEGEYLVDFASATDSFFFNWSEFTIAPVEWFRFGLLTQRTRVFSSGRELERGLLAGFSWDSIYLTLHVLNPDDAQPILITAVGGNFDP